MLIFSTKIVNKFKSIIPMITKCGYAADCKFLVHANSYDFSCKTDSFMKSLFTSNYYIYVLLSFYAKQNYNEHAKVNLNIRFSTIACY